MYWEAWGGKEMKQDFCKDRCSVEGLQSDHLYCTVWNAYWAPCGCGGKSVPRTLPPAISNCVYPWNFFPQKRREQWEPVLAKVGRAFCGASSSTTPKPRQALIPQPYCGLILWLQFSGQDGSSSQDKNKVKCTRGYIADLGKLLQLKLIWCGISLCHLSVTVVPGYSGMLDLELLDQHEGARNSLCACALRFLSSCFKFYKLFFWFVLVCPSQQIIMFIVPPKLWE